MALLELQESVDELPLVIELGDAEIEHVGAGLVVCVGNGGWLVI